MPTQFLQENAIGATIEVTIEEDGVALNVSTVSSKQLVFRKPSGTVVTKTASFSTTGADGKLKYVTEAGFLNEHSGAQNWKVQGTVTFPGGGYSGRSEVVEFAVKGNL